MVSTEYYTTTIKHYGASLGVYTIGVLGECFAKTLAMTVMLKCFHHEHVDRSDRLQKKMYWSCSCSRSSGRTARRSCSLDKNNARSVFVLFVYGALWLVFDCLGQSDRFIWPHNKINCWLKVNWQWKNHEIVVPLNFGIQCIHMWNCFCFWGWYT